MPEGVRQGVATGYLRTTYGEESPAGRRRPDDFRDDVPLREVVRRRSGGNTATECGIPERA